MRPSQAADPYRELGVARSASGADIKAAYRRLAAQWHPDRNPNAQAAERMKRINRAYRQLCGMADDDPAADAAPEPDDEPPARPARAWWERDWGRARWEPDGARLPETIRSEATIRLEDAAFGCVHRLKGTAVDLCAACAGAGRLISAGSACRTCRGEGRVRPPGRARWMRCADCGGDGADRKPCEACAATGLDPTPRRYHYEVRIPPGVRDGQIVKLRGQGQRGGAAPGDIELAIRVAPHPVFSLDGRRRLVCRIPVDFYAAAATGIVEVPTLDGTTALIDLSHGAVQRLEGQGFPARDGARGPLVVETYTVLPDGYTAAQRELLRSLADALRDGGHARCEELARWRRRLDEWKRGRESAEA